MLWWCKHFFTLEKFSKVLGIDSFNSRDLLWYIYLKIQGKTIQKQKIYVWIGFYIIYVSQNKYH